MSEDQQHHIDEQEYNELMKGVTDSGLPLGEKDRQRELLGVGYRNLNGDPMETKVRLLARTDWTQIKYMIIESGKTQRILNVVDEIKKSLDEERAPKTFWGLLFNFLNNAKAYLLAALFLLLYYPQGVKIMDGLVRMVHGGTVPTGG